ncbi:hypothetical protein Aple_036090 [Acrocarpospora pleiomorpha]|uniref:Tricarboxylate transporter n=1 Tax=Acrocarpospora pleiomorpha TaxID=90975 RepID=A0A5M3XNJ8_9ACTN|nr:tripartite tricarboxylate transporter substrate-binding protein [Acrocarpospora pleiomorpha]GES20713.1 hypothetical protein Aple_036090 [Acrocarpospora pleiomorpha]
MRRRTRAGAVVAVIAAIATACNSPSTGQVSDAKNPEEFFSGRTIRWIVPFAPGGGTDTTARQLVPFLTEHLPGHPKIQVENIDGGNGILGANQFARANPDGLTMLMTSASTNTSVLFGDPAVQFSFKDFAPIVGIPAGNTQYVSPDIGVKKPEDLLATDAQLVYGGITPGGGEISRLLSMHLLGLNVKEVFGYESRGAVQIAFSQGEVNIDGQSTAAYLESIQPLVDKGEAIPVYTTGLVENGKLVRDPAFPDLPHAAELYETVHGTPPDAELLKSFTFLVQLIHNMQKQVWLHGEAPPVAIDAMVQAFTDIQKDPDFQKTVAKSLGGYGFQSGETLKRDIDAVLNNPPDDVVTWLENYAAKEYDADLSKG